MNRIRTMVVSAIAVGLLAGSAVATTAQSDDATGPVAYVTGIRTGTEQVDMQDPYVDDKGVLHLQNVSIVQSIEWSDPRLPATMLLRGNTDVYGEQGDPSGGVPFTGALLLHGDDGSWTGTQVGYFSFDGTLSTTAVLEGQGAYAGMSAILHQSYADDEAQAADVPSWDGILIDGELPPYPDLPEPPA